jgi:hypothetical protein
MRLPGVARGGRAWPMPCIPGIQSDKSEAQRRRNFNGGYIRLLWPDWSAVADGFGS